MIVNENLPDNVEMMNAFDWTEILTPLRKWTNTVLHFLRLLKSKNSIQFINHFINLTEEQP